jgi:hypothetical protein
VLMTLPWELIVTWSKSTLSQHINEDRERLCMSVHQITEQGIHSISSISTAGKLQKSFNQKEICHYVSKCKWAKGLMTRPWELMVISFKSISS